MTTFSDLPYDILVLLAQEITPKRLRRNARNLLISKAWYQAALPVYLRQVPVKEISVIPSTLTKFPPSSGSLFVSMRSNMKLITINLHPLWGLSPRTRTTDAIWTQSISVRFSPPRGTECHLKSLEKASRSERDYQYRKFLPNDQRRSQAISWRSPIIERRADFFKTLKLMESLAEVRLQVPTERDIAASPHWTCQLRWTIREFALSLPMRVQRKVIHICSNEPDCASTSDSILTSSVKLAEGKLRRLWLKLDGALLPSSCGHCRHVGREMPYSMHDHSLPTEHGSESSTRAECSLGLQRLRIAYKPDHKYPRTEYELRREDGEGCPLYSRNVIWSR